MSVLDDPRNQQVEELVFMAERLWERDRSRALLFLGQAAEVETALAFSVSGESGRLRGALAVSAASLWRRALRYDEGLRCVYAFLASDPPLEPKYAQELVVIQFRCLAERGLASAGCDVFEAAEVGVSLDEGQVAHGIAPSDVVRTRNSVVPNVLGRVVDFSMGRPFRQRADMGRELRETYSLYEAPAIPGSYGMRWYLVPKANTGGGAAAMPRPREVVSTFLSVVSSLDADKTASFEHVVADPEYRTAFATSLRDLAPDGQLVGRVTFESTTPAYLVGRCTYEPRHRELLSQWIGKTRTDAIRLEAHGVLKVVNLRTRTPYIELVEDGGLASRYRIESGRFDDTIGPKVNRWVRVRIERRPGRGGSHTDFAQDVEVAEELPGSGAAGRPLLRWAKEMRPSDAQHPTKGSPIGYFRLSGSRMGIDHKRVFRERWFTSKWEVVQRGADSIERTTVAFDVVIGDAPVVERDLEVTHAPHRIAGQDNIPTWIRLDEFLKDTFAKNDFTGWWLVLEKYPDGRFVLRVQHEAPSNSE